MTTIKKTKKADLTRLDMLNAAIQVFGQKGYHAASNRNLADAAGVNLALISYHFDGKKGLYLAVFEYINQQMDQQIAPVLQAIQPKLDSLLKDSQQPKQNILNLCQQVIESILFNMIELLSSSQTEPWAKLILREQQEPSEAFDILYRGQFGKLLNVISQAVAIALGKRSTSQEVKIIALNLISQVQILRSARATILRFMDWQELSKKEIRLIKQQLSFNISGIINRGK